MKIVKLSPTSGIARNWLTAEIERLKALLHEKNKAFELQERLSKIQLSTISLLEKGKYE